MIIGNKEYSLNKSWYVKNGPATEPITVDELKTFARIDGDDENTLLSEIITGVRQAMEEYLGRALISQTFRMTMDYWPDMVIELPRPPLITVDGVYTINEENIETEFDQTNYYAVISSEPGKLVIKNDTTIPINTNRYTAGYIIEYTAGYGNLTTDVPYTITNAIKMWATMVYESRAVTTIPPNEIKKQIDMYKVFYI